MERQRVVVVVEAAEAAMAAVQWAARHVIRGGDSITLLHVCPLSRSKKKQRNLRRNGFQLALSFKDLCNGIAEAKVEIIVMEGDQGSTITSVINKARASTLVLGLHDQSFLYKAPLPNFGHTCRILAVKQQQSTPHATGIEFSQIEITRLRNLEPKTRFPLCLGVAWRRSRRKPPRNGTEY